MARNILVAFICLFLASCAMTPPPNPAFIGRIDALFKKSSSKTYKSQGLFKKPKAYAVGQYVVTGMTSAKERSVSRMSFVGKSQGGWVIESYSLTPTSEATTQILVKGMDQVYETGSIDDLEIVWVKVKPAGQEVQTIEGPILLMTKGLYKKALSGLNVASTGMTKGGTVTVGAGRFEGTAKATTEVSFLGWKSQSDAWFHPAVPVNGMVKSVSKSNDVVIELLGFGQSGAKRSF